MRISTYPQHPVDEAGALAPLCSGARSDNTRFKLKEQVSLHQVETLKPGALSKAKVELALIPTTSRAAARCRGVQVDTSDTRTLKGMYFQLVESQLLSTQGQPDVNLHRLTSVAALSGGSVFRPLGVSGASSETRFKLKALLSK